MPLALPAALTALLWLVLLVYDPVPCAGATYHDVLSSVKQLRYHADGIAADDLPEQRQALLSLYSAAGGSQWRLPTAPAAQGNLQESDEAWLWPSRNGSYCR
jgi:hypothetical protein